jgi:hypothetical protein
MATTRESLVDQINSLCADDPFRFTQALSPFDFAKQPTGAIDQVFRIEMASQSVLGGLNYAEDVTDQMTVWIARKHNTAHQDVYRLLEVDVTSLTSAIVRYGSTGGGDFHIPDSGRGVSFQHDAGVEYAMARLSLPINYESQL